MLNRQIGARPFILLAESVIDLYYKHLEAWIFDRNPDLLHPVCIDFLKALASGVRSGVE